MMFGKRTSSPRRLNRKKRIGLALGGGAVLGAAHIGVLRAMDEFEIPVDCIAGTSIGSFIGALFAFGKSWREIEEIALHMKWLDVSGLRLSQYGLLSNRKLGKALTDAVGNVDFSDARIPLAVVATDIGTGEKTVLTEGNVAEAVMASSCVPGVYIPLEIAGRILVDGGIVENVPVSPLRDMGAEIVVGVDLTTNHAFKRPEHIVGVLLNTFGITLRNATKLQTKQADVLVAPDLSAFNAIDTDKIAALIAIGYSEARGTFRTLVA
jgi:NTE family protein